MVMRTHLEAIRRHELECVLSIAPMSGRALEIGAANGFQAAILATRLDSVEAVDLPSSIPPGTLAHPVQRYDGRRLPFPDQCFDIVFSSNVLEHIPHVEEFQSEVARVLKPNGRAIHVLPSAGWRFWTIASHYLGAPLRVLRRRAPLTDASACGVVDVCPAPDPASRWTLRRVANALVEPRHGERGTAFSELYLFTRIAWCKLFRRCGFIVESTQPLGLFYTGDAVFGTALGIEARRSLARFFGSATIVYILRRSDGST